MWYVARGADFRWRHWDEESVLYDSRSGQTHLLTALAADAILLLEHTAHDAESLAVAVAKRYALDAPADFAREMADLLKQLNDLGLVERDPRHSG